MSSRVLIVPQKLPSVRKALQENQCGVRVSVSVYFNPLCGQKFGLIPSVISQEHRLPRKSPHPAVPIAISAFRIFDVSPTWLLAGDRTPHEVLSSSESRVRSFLRNFALLFPSPVLSLYPLRKMILPGLILTDNSSPCLLFLNSCPSTVTHLLLVVERQLSRDRLRKDLRRESISFLF